jgi:hypothetical protein
MRIIILVAVLLMGLASCKKMKGSTENFWECHKAQNLDSFAISNKMVGSWKWQKRRCFWTNREEAADKDIKLTFNANGTFSVAESGNIITQGNWHLRIIDSDMWGLDITADSEYLYGYILFCGNKLLFSNSYVDGCDQTFILSN